MKTFTMAIPGKSIVQKARGIFNTLDVTSEQVQFAAHQIEFTDVYYRLKNAMDSIQTSQENGWDLVQLDFEELEKYTARLIGDREHE